MKKEIEFTTKQVGERGKERRIELNFTMSEFGRRIGVNKSIIQRYEADGVDPKRTMIINSLADALLTTQNTAFSEGLTDKSGIYGVTIGFPSLSSNGVKPAAFPFL